MTSSFVRFLQRGATQRSLTRRGFAVCAAVPALIFGVQLAAAAGPAVVGRPAPPFELERLDGEPVTSDAYRGRPLYVNLFATWCPPCRKEMPLIVGTMGRHPAITFLAVDAQESASVIEPYLATLGIRTRVAIDRGQFAASYGARSIPESVFIDRHGIVRAIVHGPIDRATLGRHLARISGS